MSTRKKLKINFVMPPMPNLTGGPLAIVEYATRLKRRGHDVSITTYADLFWRTDHPFPWADFDGPIHYLRTGMKRANDGQRSKIGTVLGGMGSVMTGSVQNSVFSSFLKMGLFTRDGVLKQVLGESKDGDAQSIGMSDFIKSLIAASSVTSSIPQCDINIATLWLTAFPVLWSGKGKPVYFMQHYEEAIYPFDLENLTYRMMARMSYELPIYKIANSSWLASVIEDQYGQKVPWSNNGLDLSVFKPSPKLSEKDGVLRVITYARKETWKGFEDALRIMALVRKVVPNVEWNVFGYLDDKFPPNNEIANYKYHEKLPFSELAKLYAESDVALCPSWYESFPLPPIEAMAAGTAVVTTKYGTEDYARDGDTALVFGSRDIDLGAQQLIRVLQDRGLRAKLVENGLKESQKFDWETAVDRREEFLYEIYENRIQYDLYKPSQIRLRDGLGRPFEVR